ncbi:hypothetical protein JOB18_031511 [Solea senegalensis]|uniref:Uncharacterized protein n=1 Tax=Solea senegalensis TaxID=28829 RepID=A0AAV6R607_SOLSE|nr:hypothetical protein JOB18_031511 [Solea senegalensis]
MLRLLVPPVPSRANNILWHLHFTGFQTTGAELDCAEAANQLCFTDDLKSHLFEVGDNSSRHFPEIEFVALLFTRIARDHASSGGLQDLITE